jgi:putative redox protein
MSGRRDVAGTMQVSARLDGEMGFRAKTGSGHEVLMDAAPDVGGADGGARPMELLLAGLAGCTGMDVISILRKMRQDVVDYEVTVVGERAEEHPHVYTRIVVEHIVSGRGLIEANVARAVELSATRYCAASATLEKAAKVEHRYKIVAVT